MAVVIGRRAVAPVVIDGRTLTSEEFGEAPNAYGGLNLRLDRERRSRGARRGEVIDIRRLRGRPRRPDDTPQQMADSSSGACIGVRAPHLHHICTTNGELQRVVRSTTEQRHICPDLGFREKGK